MSRYHQLVEQICSLPSHKGLQPDLRRAEELDALLGFPARSYATIHVAGSNGKGSVSTKIANALERAGYRVGLYTSPHLYSFRDRILVNSLPISEEEVVEGTEQLLSLSFQPTFFELTTFLAFLYFKKRQVDVAVIETGIGGRLDCTNVIQPLLSVITSISKEHTAILGSDLESIAYQKAGIIKPSTPVVLGPKARYRAIYDQAQELHSPLFISKKISYFFDEENSETARLALQQLEAHFTLSPAAIEAGLSTRPPCRFERVHQGILDVAHNPEAIFSLLQALHTFFPQRKWRFVVGFCQDKDYAACLDLIAAVATHIHLVQAPSKRAVSPLVLQAALFRDPAVLSTAHTSLEEGVERAYRDSLEKGELLVVCGSFYIMHPARQVLDALEVRPSAGAPQPTS